MPNFSSFTLNDWLFYLEGKQAQEIQLGLSRISSVAKRLNLLQLNSQVITVAGTNGKGSTVAALETIYGVAGYRVASFTSPHLLVFNERIRINQTMIADEDLCAAFGVIEQARKAVELTYFEMTTLAALWYFKQNPLDLVILEVGMGGRLDATNIIDPDLAIITTIDLDHQDYLGDTIEAIGFEKAGILRKGKPCIYADTNPPQSILNHAQHLDAPMQCLGKNYFIATTAKNLTIQLESKNPLSLPLPSINVKAAAAAIVATTYLDALLPVTHAHCAQALAEVFIAGRQQVMKAKVTTIFDVAHNPQAVSLLATFITQVQHKNGSQSKVHAVFSALKDKDIVNLIRPMLSCIDVWYLSELKSKRATQRADLLKLFKDNFNLEPICFKDPLIGYNTAMQCAQPGDLIVVYGSFLTVSAVMAGLTTDPKQKE